VLGEAPAEALRGRAATGDKATENEAGYMSEVYGAMGSSVVVVEVGVVPGVVDGAAGVSLGRTVAGVLARSKAFFTAKMLITAPLLP